MENKSKFSEMNLISLIDIFDNNFFDIPDYQRGYAWESQHVQALWDDIENIDKGKIHYMGVISLNEVDDEERYQIVDGQQRFVTCVFLINELIDSIEKENPEYVFDYLDKKFTLNELRNKFVCNDGRFKIRFSLDETTNNAFESVLKGTLVSKSDENHYTKLMINTRKEFISNIEKCKNKILFLEKVLVCLKFNCLTIPKGQNSDFLDIRLIFEAMNNRGKPLSNLEKLKNRLMYLAFQLKNKELMKDINSKWNSIYKNLCLEEGLNNGIAFDNLFLECHWLVYTSYSEKIKSSKDFYVKDLFENKFKNNSLYANGENIRNYINSLKDFSDAWNLFYKGNIGSEENSINNYIEKIKRLTNEKYVNAFICACIHNYVKFKGFSFFNELKNETEIILKNLERFLFIDKYLLKVGQRATPMKFLVSSNEVLVTNLEERRILIENNAKILIENLKKISKNKLQICNYEEVKNHFVDYISDKFKDGNVKGYFYGWYDGLKYFFNEYNLYLATKEYTDATGTYCCLYLNETKKRGWNSIEHIMPQNTENEYWNIVLQNYKNQEIKIINSIGNLMPLKQSLNSRFQNYPYIIKREGRSINRKNDAGESVNEIYSYLNGSACERLVANKCKYWTVNDIYDRAIDVIKFFNTRWGVDFSEEQVKKLVGFELNENDDVKKIKEQLKSREQEDKKLFSK